MVRGFNGSRPVSDNTRGFTIVELLIVVVVIAILAAITIVSYNGITARAYESKISSDLATIKKAVMIARDNQQQVMGQLTGSWATGYPCWSKPDGTNLASLPRATDTCWTYYDRFLNTISEASGVNIRNMVDPWGRPYFIDENEGEVPAMSCSTDTIAVYSRPFVTNFGSRQYSQPIPASGYSGC